MNLSFKQRFSNDLYRARNNAGLTQREAAERASISIRSYQRIESGLALPTIVSFLSLVRLFKLDMNDYANTDAVVEQ